MKHSGVADSASGSSGMEIKASMTNISGNKVKAHPGLK